MAVEQDQQFIEYVVKNIVDHPDEVEIERSIDDRGVLLKLTVNQEDMGKIIGKGGATAKAIRTLLRVLGAKSDERFNLKIVDPEGSEHPGADRDRSSTEREQTTEDKLVESNEVDAQPEVVATPEPDEDIEAMKSKAREGLDDLNLDI